MNSIAGKPRELKKVNTSLILKSIKDRVTATRSQIVEDTNISHTTVRAILKELIESEEIVVSGLDESSGGRRAERYKINAGKKHILSISIERNKMFSRVVNIVGDIVEEKQINLNGLDDNKAILEEIDILSERYKDIKCIGVSVPGIVTSKGYLSGLGVDDWREINLKELIEARYNIPTILENDLNSIALGFSKAYKENGNIVYLSFTTLGAGAGIIINGNLLRGENGYAGEIGIMPMGNSFLNNMILNDLDDIEYCTTIVNTIKIISSILNPKIIVLGGNSFRYELEYDIKERYNHEANISVELLTDKNERSNVLLGITEISLQYINDEVKLLNVKN